ncbi:hypothetical protein AcV5_010371 [Taiwanofungus camphoratus]|nr:hypothetical protein AcV5_010371 [Antrodia cinnamomea]
MMEQQTSRRMLAVTKLRSVWHNAYVHEVRHKGYPFPRRSVTSMDSIDLELAVRRAVCLGIFWHSPVGHPRKLIDFQASSGTGVSDVRFLAGYSGKRLVTVSKGIWSIITCWEVTSGHCSSESTCAHKVAEWCPKGIIFTGFIVNSDPDSKGIIATSVNIGGRQGIEILSLVSQGKQQPAFRSISTFDTSFRPVALQGDLLAFSDDSSETVILNWMTGTTAILRGSEEPIDHHFQYNRCLQIVFAHKSILVIRARSIELFAEPSLRPPSELCSAYRPIAYHSFGWIDGVSVKTQVNISEAKFPFQPLSILLRTESDDPWTSDVHKLDLFILEPNSSFTSDPPCSSTEATVNVPELNLLPYRFPPVHSKLTSPSVRGFLRCTDIKLGSYGTAVWIQPRPSRSADLTALDVHSSETQGPEGLMLNESLVAAAFAGPLQRPHPDLGARTLWTQTTVGSNWTTIDYDEELGRIAMGSTQGKVTLLELG